MNVFIPSTYNSWSYGSSFSGGLQQNRDFLFVKELKFCSKYASSCGQTIKSGQTFQMMWQWIGGPNIIQRAPRPKAKTIVDGCIIFGLF